MTVALVTDSNSQIPSSLRDRYNVLVVPLAVTIDGAVYREGVDLTTADFYSRLAAGAAVGTAAPAPGEVLAVFDAAVASGADEIVAVHLGSNASATVNAVRIAAGMTSTPVDALAAGVAEAFVVALRARSEVAEIVRYEIGPSVGAHTGAGTVGACFFVP